MNEDNYLIEIVVDNQNNIVSNNKIIHEFHRWLKSPNTILNLTNNELINWLKDDRLPTTVQEAKKLKEKHEFIKIIINYLKNDPVKTQIFKEYWDVEAQQYLVL
jgi:hypothetical protein